jgi:glycerophosphoryl diester phosphodiesterase
LYYIFNYHLHYCKFSVVIAHRGFSALHPENTLQAISAAFDSLADGIEIDVHLTADNEVILQHDQNLDRMTEGGAGNVIDRPWYGYIENLKTISSGEPVCRLQDVLSYLSLPNESSARFLVLDVKDDQPVEILSHISKLLLSHTIPANLVIYLGVWNEEFALEAQRVFSSSFAPSYGLAFKLTLIAESCTEDQITGSSLFHAFNLNVDTVTDKVFEAAKLADKDVLLWTCNSEKQIEKALKSSCRAILTDDPRLIK